jgi:hypothetical protein
MTADVISWKLRTVVGPWKLRINHDEGTPSVCQKDRDVYIDLGSYVLSPQECIHMGIHMAIDTLNNSPQGRVHCSYTACLYLFIYVFMYAFVPLGHQEGNSPILSELAVVIQVQYKCFIKTNRLMNLWWKGIHI